MANFSTIVLPPVLDYNYPGFDLEKDFTFTVSLSIQNTLKQVDHAQIKIIAFDTDKNAFNKAVIPQDIYFVDFKNKDNLDINIAAFINDIRVLKESYPQYYKMQIRFGEATIEEPYDSAWGQNPPENWLITNRSNFSEWSNTSLLKSVKKPEIEIIGLKNQPYLNIVVIPENVWNGAYYTEDANESIEYYYFSLYDENGKLLEEQDKTYSGDAITISPIHKFKYMMSPQKKYKIKFSISTTSSYKDSIIYNIEAGFSSVKLFSVFSVKENNEEAYNELKISGNQIQLTSSLPLANEDWKSDLSTTALGESSITHIRIPLNCEILTPEIFSMPSDDFCCLVSITNFREKIMPRMKDCITRNGCMLYLGQKNIKEYGSEYFLGCTHNDSTNKTSFILKEELKSNGEVVSSNIFKAPIADYVEDNKEYLVIIKKEGGETLFEATKWLDNNFI